MEGSQDTPQEPNSELIETKKELADTLSKYQKLQELSKTSSNERCNMFLNELNDIHDQKLRDFAKILLTNADEYFFLVPASSTGKYHPPFAQGVGGLVRHTKAVEFFALCEAESRDFTEHDTDLLIVAAIAHDIKKQGNGRSHYTVPEHPRLAQEYILEEARKHPELISEEDAIIMANAVHSHMGKWGVKDSLPVPVTELEKALQAADYIASRKEILAFKFERDPPPKTNEPKRKGPKPNQKQNPGLKDVVELHTNESNINLNQNDEYVFNFGKHKGKKASEVAKTNKDYFYWVKTHFKEDSYSKYPGLKNVVEFYTNESNINLNQIDK